MQSTPLIPNPYKHLPPPPRFWGLLLQGTLLTALMVWVAGEAQAEITEVSLSSTTIVEGDDGFTYFEVTARRKSLGIFSFDGAFPSRTFTAHIIHGTTNDADFAIPRVMDIRFGRDQRGSTRARFRIVGDRRIESDETFRVRVQGINSPIATISNDDAHIQFSGPARIKEADTNVVSMPYTISTRLSGFPLNQVITWNIVHGSTTDADFVGTSGTFLLNNGYPSTRGTNTLAIPIAGDNLNEGDETFSIELSAGAFSTEGPLTVTLDDDDDDTVFTVTGQARVTEPTVSVGRSNYYTYTVTRSGAPLTADTTVEWVLIHGTTSAADVSGGGTSAIDVNGSIRGTLTFSPGVDVMTFGVNIARDTLTETDETFTLTTYDPDPNIFSGVPLTVTIAATAGTDALAWIRDAGAATVITAGETIQVPLVILGGGPRPGIRVIGYCITGSVEAADYSVVTRIFTPRTFFANPYSSRGGCPDGPGPGGFLDFRLMDNERNLPIVVANSAAGKTLTVTLISHGNVLSGSTTYRYDPAPRTYTIVTDTAPAFASGTTQPGLTYVQNTPIPALTLPPASAGNGTTTYTLTPLPDGLTFTAGTRVLSGTPTTVAGAVALTYTAADADGDSDTLTFSVTVIAPDTAPAFAAGTTPPAQTYTVGVGITALTLPLAGGGNGTVTYALSPAVAGLTFDPGTRVLSGTPTTVADAVALTYTAADSDDNTDASDEIRLTFVVTITPAPAVVIAPVTLTVLEAQSEIYTVRISAAPSGGDVTVTPTAGAGLTLSRNGVSLSPSGALTFTADNWNTAQTITVAAAEDDDAVNDTVTISHAVIGADYGGVDAADVTVTITENERVGFEVIQTALTVNESATDTYTVRLTSAPSIGNVTVMPSSRDFSVVTVSTTALVFTAGNWNTHQTVTVTGVADDDAVADAPVSITNAVTASDDSSDYDGATADGVTVTVTDTDMAGITIAPPTQTVAEGADAVYSVVLDTEPSAAVTVMPMMPTPPAGLTVDTGDLTALSFTTGNWNVAQTVSLTVLDDEDALGGDIALTYTATGGDYAAATAGVTFTVTDNMPSRGLTVLVDALSVEEGGSRTYTVALTSLPVGGDVTVTPASGDTSVATLSPAMLVFSGATWNDAQTVTVTGVHDADAGAAGDTATLTHTVNGGGSDYVAGDTDTDDNVAVTVTEDDMAGITIAPPTQSVNEGADAVYSVVLDTEPSAVVTVTPMTPTLPAGLTVETTDLTALSFTTGDWNVAQTVSLTVLDDDDALGGDIALTYTATGGDYAAATAGVTFTVTDDVPPRGLTVSVDVLSVEEGGSRTYTVALTSLPVGGDVTVTPASGDTGVATVSGALTFTATTWNDAQTVTVTGEQDADASSATATLTHTLNPGGSDYVVGDADTDDNVVVTVTEDDMAGITITPPTQTVNEGADAVYSVVLDTEPSANVVVTPMTPTLPAGLTVDTTDLTALSFTAGNWNVAQTVSLTVLDDSDALGGDIALTYTATGGDYAAATAGVTFTVTDNVPPRGLTVLVDALSVEEGGSRTYTVALTSLPVGGDVTVTPASGDITVATVSPAMLVFSDATWNTPQTVTVTAEHDAVAAGDTATLTHTLNPGASDYVAGDTDTNDNVVVTIADTAPAFADGASQADQTYTAGVAITALTLPAAGGGNGATTYALDVSAVAGLTFTAATRVLSGAPRGVTAAVVLTYTAADSDDNIAAGDTATLTFAVTVNPASSPQVALTPATLTVVEDGSATYSVALLGAPPAGALTVTPGVAPSSPVLTLSADGGAPVAGDALTFTADNWNQAQSVTVTAAADADGITNIVTISHTASGANYTTAAAATAALPVSVFERVTVGFAQTAYTVAEDAGVVNVCVSVSTPAVGGTVEGLFSVLVSTTDGTATSPADYAALSDSAVTATTDPRRACFNITIADNEVAESSETFTVSITGVASGNSVLEPTIDSTTATATVTLTDDDTAGVTVTQAVTPLSVPEDGSGFYTVQLNTDPAATTVTITPLSADPSVATVSGALTFVSAGANWNIAQTVTVRGVEDADAIADAVVSITHAVANYGGATARAVPVRVTEDDTDRVAVMPATVGVTEGAATFYTVALETQPAGDVTVTPGVTPVRHDLTLSRNGVPLMPSNALVFTTANWNEAQTVSVTAGEDDDGNDDSATISHTVSGYGSVVAGDVGVMVTDDDMRGVTIDPATLLVDEDGNDTYTVRLDTEPDGEVTVMPSSGDDDIATIAPVSLVFTTGNWNDAQSVTVTGIKDADAVADAAVAIANTLSGSADYAGITAGSVTVTVNETDMRGVMISTASLGVTESEAVAYAVVLTAAPSGGDVTVTPMSDAPAVTVSGELVFTAGTWNTAQSVTVTGVEDANSVTDTANITHAVAGADYDGIAANPVAVMVTDNDTPGVTVDPVTLAVNEGGNGAYTVRLTTEPGGNVTITPVSDTPAATVSGALVFTIGTWNVAQTVTVTGAHDADASNAAANITHTVSGYGGVTIEDVAVTIIDDETAGVTVNPVTLTVNEGGINTYTVRLDSEPSGNVMVTPASNNTAAATVSGALVFTAGTWNTPQMVTVSGIDDADAVNASANIMHSVSGYGSVSAAAPVAVTVTDDETAGVTISLTRLSVNEGGGAGSAYTVVLNTEPSGAVVVMPSSDNGEVSVSPNTLNFNAGDWSAPKTVVVSAAEDDDGSDDTATISHAVSGADYAGIDADSVTVRVTDDDPRGVMISTATVGMTEGESAFYGVVLLAAPSGGDVTVTPVSDVIATATVSGALVFTGGNWNRAQTVTVTGVEDANGVTDTANITHTVAGADYGSNGINAATVAATVNDNDTPGVMISTDSLTVAEGGEGVYSVRLTTRPGGNVVITPSSDTPATVSGALTFSADNWNVAQRVTVTGAQDADAVDAGANITHTVSGYGDVTAENVAVTIIDDETAGVTVTPARLSVNEGSSSGAGNTYTVVLDSAPSGAVIVMLSSDNSDVSVNRATLNFNAGNWNVTQQVVVSAADDDDGNPDTATISHTANGADYAGVSAAPVVVTVTDDEVPGITLSARTMAVNEGGNGEYTIRLNTSPSGNATVTPSSSDAAVTVSPTALVFTRDNWSMGQQVRVTAADDADGLDDTATITHAIAGYAGVTAADPVAVTVTDNDMPAVTISPQTLTVDEGDGAIYTVRLATEPSGDVRVAPSSGDTAIATVSGALSFTTGNWNTAQSVTVSGARIDGVDDDRVIIAHTVSGADYAAVTAASVAVSVRADRIVFTPLSDLPVSADGNLQAPLGGSIPYTMVLSTPPAAGERVVVTLTLSHGAPFSVTATGGLDLAVTNHIEDIVRAFTFTSANWNVPQTAMFTVPADDPPGTMYTLTPTRTDGGGTDYAIAAPLVFVAAAASTAGELDALNEVILPEMARALSDRQVGAIARRVEAARAAGAGAGLRVGGQSSPAALAATQMSAAADEGLDGKRLLDASDFVLPLNAGADGGAGAAFWGGGDYRHLGGESGEIDWDGDLLSLNVGVDAHLQNDLLVGVMVSWSEADLDYTDDSADTRRSGDYELDMTGVHPYLGWSTFSGGLDLWTTLGYGSGEVEITHDENATRSSSDVALRTIGIGGSGRLLALGESELRVKAEAFSTRTEVEGGDAARLSELEVSVSRMRLALQAGTSVITATGARAEPSLELGYRYDGGDGETGGGVELGSALRYTSPAHGVTLEGHIRALMGHSGDSKELSIGGNLRLSAGADGQGLSLSLSPGYGATGSGVEDIWKGGLSADTDPQARLNARVGYGLPGAIFMLTPYGEMALGEDERNYRLGFRWGLGGEVDLDLVGGRHKKDDAVADHAIWLKGEVRF